MATSSWRKAPKSASSAPHRGTPCQRYPGPERWEQDQHGLTTLQNCGPIYYLENIFQERGTTVLLATQYKSCPPSFDAAAGQDKAERERERESTPKSNACVEFIATWDDTFLGFLSTTCLPLERGGVALAVAESSANIPQNPPHEQNILSSSGALQSLHVVVLPHKSLFQYSVTQSVE